MLTAEQKAMAGQLIQLLKQQPGRCLAGWAAEPTSAHSAVVTSEERAKQALRDLANSKPENALRILTEAFDEHADAAWARGVAVGGEV